MFCVGMVVRELGESTLMTVEEVDSHPYRIRTSWFNAEGTLTRKWWAPHELVEHEDELP